MVFLVSIIGDFRRKVKKTNGRRGWESILLYIYFPIMGSQKKDGEERKMVGDVMVILGLALYVPMSMVFMFRRR